MKRALVFVTLLLTVCASAQRSNRSFSIAAVGDVQVGDLQELSYANQTIFSELASRNDITFNIFLGDLVNDNQSLLPIIANVINTLPTPSKALVGNHDRDFFAKEQDSTFKTIFGESTYSFNHKDVHFIVLNNVYSEGGRGYDGRISENQVQFIKEDIEKLPKKILIVLCQHIPMYYTKNKEEVLDLFKDRASVLILSGHTHQVSRHLLADNVMELVAGSSCGNWWVGERDTYGIPLAMMQCGSPRNYFVVTFDKNNYSFKFKGVGLDDNKQMDIWVNAEDSVHSHIDSLNILSPRAVVANIFAGYDSTRVTIQIDSGESFNMVKCEMISPNVSRLLYMNKNGGYPTMFSRRGAIRRSGSPHVWYFELPENLKGIHKITITAKDNYGLDVTSHKVVNLHSSVLHSSVLKK